MDKKELLNAVEDVIKSLYNTEDLIDLSNVIKSRFSDRISFLYCADPTVKMHPKQGSGQYPMVFKTMGEGGVNEFVIPASMTHDIEVLRELPAYLKAKIMALSVEDMRALALEKEEVLKQQRLSFLKQQRYWRESGEPFKYDEMDIQLFFLVKTTKSGLIQKIKHDKIEEHVLVEAFETLEKDTYTKEYED